MTTERGQIFACQDGEGVFIRVVGHATAQHCPALRKYAEEGLASGALQVCIDLEQCTYFDSTFLGTLLHLRKRRCGTSSAAFTLAAPSAPCQALLRQMGVQSLFAVETQSADHAAAWQELSDTVDSRNTLSFKQSVVTAHEELAEVPSSQQAKFRAVATACRQELESQATQSATRP